MKTRDMKATPPNWLDNPMLSHVQACCVRLPNGECNVQVAGTEPTSEDFARAMKIVAAAVPPLIQQRLLPGHMVWTFSAGKLHYAVRPDGSALGLYCKSGSEAEAAGVADFIAEFLQRA
jgi:hypothetical protein